MGYDAETEINSMMTKQKIKLIGALLLGVAASNYWLNWQLGGIPVPLFATLSVFAVCLVWWLTLGIEWTSLACLACLALIPEIGAKKVFSSAFGNETFVFLLFTFMATYALNQTPLLRRLVAWFTQNRWITGQPLRLWLAFYGAIWLLSTCMSPTIVFMFSFSLFEALCADCQIEKGSSLGGRLLIVLFTLIATGTAMTPINHVFAITAMTLWANVQGVTLDFQQYWQFAFPVGIIMTSLLFGYVCLVLGKPLNQLPSIQREGKLGQLQMFGPMSQRERWLGFLFAGLVAVWLLPVLVPSFSFVNRMGIAVPPLVCCILMASIEVEGSPLMSVSDAFSKGVHWPSMCLVGAALSLGSALSMETIGLTTYLQTLLEPIFSQSSGELIILVVIVWALWQTNVFSNLVTVTVVTTIVLSLQSALPSTVSLELLCAVIGFYASFAVLTPPSMPYVAISVGSGWTTNRQVIRFGFISMLTILMIGWLYSLIL